MNWVSKKLAKLCIETDVFHFIDNQANGESDAKTTNDHANTTKRWDFIVPRTANDALNESLKDSCKGLKGSKKEMRKLKKQIATRQRRLFALHQQHIANKTHAYEDFGPSASPPSPFQITQWNKQFRQKVKKVLSSLCSYSSAIHFVREGKCCP